MRRVEQQQYRVDVSDSKQEAATVQCHFSRSRDLMFVLLPREVRVCLEATVGIPEECCSAGCRYM